MELDAGPEPEVDRLVIDQLPLGGEVGLDLERRGIAMHQHVPRMVGEHEPSALAVHIGVDIRHTVAEDDAQIVGRLLRDNRRRTERHQSRDAQAEQPRPDVLWQTHGHPPEGLG